jgi:cellulose synthase/poly-beta-1,6-N-acetylglucosamine synthase-like glycosyltransferase
MAIKISSVLPVKNEEGRVLREHLSNLRQFCYEIIVIVDEDCIDNTFTISKEYSDKVYKYKSELGIIPEARKFGEKYVEGDWILMDDADFFYNEAFVTELEKLDKTNATVVKVPLCNYMFGKWFTNPLHFHIQERLLKAGAASLNVIDSHTIDINTDGVSIEFANPILHYGLPSIEYLVDRINNYTSKDATVLAKGIRSGYFQRILTDFNKDNFLLDGFRFSKNFYKNEYDKEGFHGMIYSNLVGFIMFLENAKTYELLYKKGIPDNYLENIAKFDINQIKGNPNEYYLQGSTPKINKCKKIVVLFMPPIFVTLLIKLRNIIKSNRGKKI